MVRLRDPELFTLTHFAPTTSGDLLDAYLLLENIIDNSVDNEFFTLAQAEVIIARGLGSSRSLARDLLQQLIRVEAIKPIK